MKCSGCGEDKADDQFHGHRRQCNQCRAAYMRGLYRRNERMRARAIARVKANKPRWMAANRPRLHEYDAQRRRARRRVPWYVRSRVLRYYQVARWLRERGLDVHVDHYVPLRGRAVCGLHVADNVRLAFAGPNLRKWASWDPAAEHEPGPLQGQFREIRWTFST